MADRLARRAALAYVQGMLDNHRPDRGALAELLHTQAEQYGDRALATALEKHRTEVTLLDEVEREVTAICQYASGGADGYWREHEHELPEEVRHGRVG